MASPRSLFTEVYSRSSKSKIMKFLKLIILVNIFSLTIVKAQEKHFKTKYKNTSVINKELTFTTNSPENILVVDNVYGSINVKGYDGTKILVEVTKTIYANTKEDIEKGKQDIGINTAKKEGAIYVYLNSPYSSFDIETGNFEHREFSYNSKRNYKHRSKRMYKYVLNYTIKVPKKTSLDVRAVNKGDIYVENVHGKLLIVKNVNGAIDLNNVSGKTDVNALNKDINITYANNPTEESWYKSLNGDINITFKNTLNAIINYKTMNGKFYTNFDVENTEPKMMKTKAYKEKKKRVGTEYKINSRSHFKIGNGNVQLHFDQLNGDAIVKK